MVQTTTTLTKQTGSRRRRRKPRQAVYSLRIDGKSVGTYSAEETRELSQVMRLGRVGANALAHNRYRPTKRGIERNMAQAGVKIAGNHIRKAA